MGMVYLATILLFACSINASVADDVGDKWIVMENDVINLKNELAAVVSFLKHTQIDLKLTKDDLKATKSELLQLKAKMLSAKESLKKQLGYKASLRYTNDQMNNMKWHALHMSAGAACLAATSNQNISSPVVKPGVGGETCAQTCSRPSSKPNCDAQVLIFGHPMKAHWNGETSAKYGHFDCNQPASGTMVSEVSASNDVINFIGTAVYCCCH